MGQPGPLRIRGGSSSIKKKGTGNFFSPSHLIRGLSGLNPWVGGSVRQPTKFKYYFILFNYYYKFIIIKKLNFYIVDRNSSDNSHSVVEQDQTIAKSNRISNLLMVHKQPCTFLNFLKI